MGSRASQPLRNRQQVQDSSAVVVAGVGSDGPTNFDCPDQAKAICDNNNGTNLNNNNNNIHDDDVAIIKEALHAVAAVAAANQGSGDTQQQLDGVQQANGNKNNSKIPAADQQKGSTLQRQASHIQSLAQRIRRSSSVRRFLPSFVNGKRKVSIYLALVVFISHVERVLFRAEKEGEHSERGHIIKSTCHANKQRLVI